MMMMMMMRAVSLCSLSNDPSQFAAVCFSWTFVPTRGGRVRKQRYVNNDQQTGRPLTFNLWRPGNPKSTENSNKSLGVFTSLWPAAPVCPSVFFTLKIWNFLLVILKLFIFQLSTTEYWNVLKRTDGKLSGGKKWTETCWGDVSTVSKIWKTSEHFLILDWFLPAAVDPAGVSSSLFILNQWKPVSPPEGGAIIPIWNFLFSLRIPSSDF